MKTHPSLIRLGLLLVLVLVLFALALTLWPSRSNATPPSTTPVSNTLTPPSNTPAETCQSVGDLARIIMTNRQQGVDMGQMMNLASKAQPPATAELGVKLIEAAYAQPHYQTPDVQQTTIADFANQAYMLCYKAYH